MPGKLDEISRTIGAIETAINELQRRADEDRRIRNQFHAQNQHAIAELARKLEQHAIAVTDLRLTVAALEMSHSKLATWASIGITVVVFAGWVLEAGVKWIMNLILSKFGGG